MSGKNDEEGIMNLGQSFQRSSQSPPMASRPPMSNPIFPIVFMIRRRPRSRPKQVVSRRRSGDPGGVSCMSCVQYESNTPASRGGIESVL